MDEEDGRLGPPPGHIIGKAPTRPPLMHVTGGRAQHTGRADVLWDALAMSLCHPSLTDYNSSFPAPASSSLLPNHSATFKPSYQGEML